MLTFEIKDSEQIEIHANQQGLDTLIRDLTRLRDASQGPDHVHLFTEAWGGHPLTQKRQGARNGLVHHVKIYKW